MNNSTRAGVIQNVINQRNIKLLDFLGNFDYLSVYSQIKVMLAQESIKEEETDLEESIKIPRNELKELVRDNEKLEVIILQYNHKAAHNLNRDKYRLALLYLQEAEKILEYAASSGKSIERTLIILTLQNVACVYQRMWETEKAEEYLEAVLYNLNIAIRDGSPVDQYHILRVKQSAHNPNFVSFLNNLIKTAVCYLQHATICSQLAKHQQAIKSVRKSMQILGEFLHELNSYESYLKGKVIKKSIVKRLREQSKGVYRNKLQNLVVENKKQLNLLKKQDSLQFEGKQTITLQKFTMSSILELKCNANINKQLNASLDDMLSPLFLQNIALYISICYYSLATEVRLLNISLDNLEDKSLNIEKSKFLHLNSVRVALDYVPCINDYLNHIIRSLKNVFFIDLHACDDIQESKVLFISSDILEDDTLFLQQDLKDDEVPTKNILKDEGLKESIYINQIHSPKVVVKKYAQQSPSKSQKVKKIQSKKYPKPKERTSVVSKSPSSHCHTPRSSSFKTPSQKSLKLRNPETKRDSSRKNPLKNKFFFRIEQQRQEERTKKLIDQLINRKQTQSILVTRKEFKSPNPKIVKNKKKKKNPVLKNSDKKIMESDKKIRTKIKTFK